MKMIFIQSIGLFVLINLCYLCAGFTDKEEWEESFLLQDALCNCTISIITPLLEKHPDWVNAPFNHTRYLTMIGFCKFKIHKVPTLFHAAATALSRSDEGLWERGSMDRIMRRMLNTGKVDLTVTNYDGLNAIHLTADPRLTVPFQKLLEYAVKHEQIAVLEHKSAVVGTPLMFLISKDRSRAKPEYVAMINSLVATGINVDVNAQGELVRFNQAFVTYINEGDFRSFQILYDEYLLNPEDMEGISRPNVIKKYPQIAMYLCLYGEFWFCF